MQLIISLMRSGEWEREQKSRTQWGWQCVVDVAKHVARAYGKKQIKIVCDNRKIISGRWETFIRSCVRYRHQLVPAWLHLIDRERSVLDPAVREWRQCAAVVHTFISIIYGKNCMTRTIAWECSYRWPLAVCIWSAVPPANPISNWILCLFFFFVVLERNKFIAQKFPRPFDKWLKTYKIVSEIRDQFGAHFPVLSQLSLVLWRF